MFRMTGMAGMGRLGCGWMRDGIGSASSVWAGDSLRSRALQGRKRVRCGSTSAEAGPVSDSPSGIPSSSVATASADILNLALSTFDCTEYHKTLWYPQVLSLRHCLKGGTESRCFEEAQSLGWASGFRM